MKMYQTTQPIEKYLNIPLECSCGRTHFAPIKAIRVSSGAISLLPDYMKQYGYSHPYLLSDRITYDIAGYRCETILQQAGFSPFTRILTHMAYDEATLGEIVLNKPDDCDVMIGIGTGQITDMLRFASFKLGLPCFTVPTAAPMDGFSASVGIMNVDHLKATMPAHASEVILGDTDVLKGAPMRMTLAGFGDLVGKYNALNDWRLGRIVNGEHYCEKIATMVEDYVTGVTEDADRIRDKDPETIGGILNALLLTGATVSLYGTSRAISGAEHHMSHYWEVLGDERGKPFAMHGEQVAVATVLALSVVEKLEDRAIDFNRARAAARRYDSDAWAARIRLAYGEAAEAILALEKKSQKNAPEGRLKRIDAMEEKWPEIRSLLETVIPAGQLRELLQSLGCPCDPKDIGVTPEILKDTFLYCKETRTIFTVYQMAWDLDLMDEISDEIIRFLKQENRI